MPGRVRCWLRCAATAITSGELDWPESWPAIPCHDLSGVVAATGPAAADWQPGDEVYGLVGFDRPGAAAEYVTAPAADLAAKPDGVDHLAAAAVPLGGLTAWQALHQHAQLQPGQHVLVHGGAGGVGAYAVQLAALYGARVTATASARDLDFVAGLGARDVLDYSGRFEDHVRDVDVVIDPVGGTTTARSWPTLRSGGILVAIAAEPDPGQGGRGDVRSVFFVVAPDGGQLRELAGLIGKRTAAPGRLDGLRPGRPARSLPGRAGRPAPGQGDHQGRAERTPRNRLIRCGRPCGSGTELSRRGVDAHTATARISPELPERHRLSAPGDLVARPAVHRTARSCVITTARAPQ